ncbi:hypothetical protein NRF20_12950 [Streptomyces sp. R-74717]
MLSLPVADELPDTTAVWVSAPRPVHRTEALHPRNPDDRVRAAVTALMHS